MHLSNGCIVLSRLLMFSSGPSKGCLSTVQDGVNLKLSADELAALDELGEESEPAV